MNLEWHNLYDRKTGAISLGSGDIEAEEELDDDPE